MQIYHPIFKLYLDIRRAKKNGLFPVKIRLNYINEQVYYSTGIDLNQSDFELICKDKSPKHLRDIKLKLDALLSKAKLCQQSLQVFSITKFEEIFLSKQPSRKSLIQLFEKIIQEKKVAGAIGTASNYQSSINSLKEFKINLSFEDMSPSFLKNYEAHLTDNGKSISTVGIYLRPLRAILNIALEEKLIDADNYPFKKGKYTIPSSKNTKKALSKVEIKNLFNLELPSMSMKDKARDFWILSYLCNGMNMTDLCNLKKENVDGEFLRFVRQKTSTTTRANQSQISVPLLPLTKELISKWSIDSNSSNPFIFGIISDTYTPAMKRAKIKQFTKTVNKYMKIISVEQGFKTTALTYSARHSFSQILKLSGASIDMISESLGHSSQAVTKSYLDSFDDESKLKLSHNLLDF